MPSLIPAGLSRRVAERTFFSVIQRIKLGSLTVELPNGRQEHVDSGQPGPAAVLRIHDDGFYPRMVYGGEIGFGEAYQHGHCSSPDLVALLELALVNRRAIDLNKGPLKLLSRWKNLRLHRARANTVEGSRHNIHAHYDLGNDFFGLWLDETMTYSSALFTEPGQDLAEAQRAKYRRLCTLAGIKEGDRVLEIGTGWGGFATLAAQEFGAQVTTLTISTEQAKLARERIAAAGLTEKVEVRLQDYRETDGQFDAIVSIEMFEAVGAEFFETFFTACSRVLRPGGKLAMQVITVPDARFEAQRTGVNWIQKYIFPGGVLPSVGAMERANAHTGLVVRSVEDIGLDYAETLRLWRERFWERIDDVRAQGYDEFFINTWDYYLAACEAGFRSYTTGDVHIVFEKPAEG